MARQARAPGRGSQLAERAAEVLTTTAAGRVWLGACQVVEEARNGTAAGGDGGAPSAVEALPSQLLNFWLLLHADALAATLRRSARALWALRRGRNGSLVS